MKNYFLLLVLIIGIVAQKDGNKNKEGNKGNVNNSNDEDFEDYGNPDIYGLIERPCANFDRYCIRGFFAQHSKCRISPGPVEEPFFVTQLDIYVSEINATATANDSELRGLNGRIQDFYINKATGNLVLVVYFENVSVSSRQTYFRFFRNGKEPVEASDITGIDYKQLTVTIVIPNYEDLQLENAEISGYLDDAFPPFILGPRIVANGDPTAESAVLALLADIPTAARANVLTLAPLVGKIYVQYQICDFGVPINKIGYN